MKMHSKTKRIVITALMAAMVCVATMIIKIPSPMKGYLNIGDCMDNLKDMMYCIGETFITFLKLWINQFTLIRCSAAYCSTEICLL